LDDWSLGSAWRPSAQLGGTPGSVSLLAGDVDGNLRVDLVDAAIVQASLGIASGATRGQGDLNGDGAVNRADVAIVAREFGRSLSAAPSSAAPSSAAIVATARERRIADDATRPSLAAIGTRSTSRRIAALHADRTLDALTSPANDSPLAAYRNRSNTRRL
jgi:hypothetical protein